MRLGIVVLAGAGIAILRGCYAAGVDLYHFVRWLL